MRNGCRVRNVSVIVECGLFGRYLSNVTSHVTVIHGQGEWSCQHRHKVSCTSLLYEDSSQKIQQCIIVSFFVTCNELIIIDRKDLSDTKNIAPYNFVT